MRTSMVIAAVMAIAGALFAGMELSSARLYRKQGEWLKSLEFYNQALEKEPDNLAAYFERGELYKDIAADPAKAGMAKEIAGDAPDAAAELYDRMLADFRNAQTPHSDKDEKDAKKITKDVNKILQERWNHFYFQAVQFDSVFSARMAAGETAEAAAPSANQALRELDLAIKVQPEKWNAFGLKAQIFGRLGDRAAALDNWTLARQTIEKSDMRKKEPDDYDQAIAVIFGNLLENNYNLDRYPETVHIADEILKQNPESVDAVQFKAFALAQMATDDSLTKAQSDSMKQVAIDALEFARKVRPDDPIIAFYIGQFNLQLQDTAAAISAFEDLLKIDSTDREVLFALGVIHLEGGSYVDTRKALDLFRRITELDSNHAGGWINYGIALIRLGDNEAGRAAIEKGRALEK